MLGSMLSACAFQLLRWAGWRRVLGFTTDCTHPRESPVYVSKPVVGLMPVVVPPGGTLVLWSNSPVDILARRVLRRAPVLAPPRGALAVLWGRHHAWCATSLHA